jgi:hypothetical protein
LVRRRKVMDRLLLFESSAGFAEPNESNLCSIGSAVAAVVMQRTRVLWDERANGRSGKIVPVSA